MQFNQFMYSCTSLHMSYSNLCRKEFVFFYKVVGFWKDFKHLTQHALLSSTQYDQQMFVYLFIGKNYIWPLSYQENVYFYQKVCCTVT